MPAPDHEETANDPAAPTSRRAFLGLAAAAGGAGLTAAPAVADSSDGQSVTVVASPGQSDAVHSAADRLRELRPGTRIALDVAETARGIELFTAGEVEIVASDRPLLPTERARAGEHGVDQEIEEVPTDVGTLTRPGSAWVDPLRPSRIAETWSDEGLVSTWAEVPSDDVDTDDATSGVSGPASVDVHESVLVRGVRDAQYATGHGGVGYYEPERAWLEARGGEPEPAFDDAADTPVVRLAYLGVDRASLRTPVVEDVVRAFSDVSADRVGELPFFEDPYGVTAT